MSPTGNSMSANPPGPADPHLSRLYKEASTSRWQLEGLFKTFLEGRPADTILAVQERRLLISWDLKGIHYLRICLRTWIQDKVPGDAIGAFLVKVLYEQDFHLDYLLTMMVRDGQTQLHIARRLLTFYQIRDEVGAPIWDNVTVYAEDAHKNPPAIQRKNVAGSSGITRKELPHRIPTPPPAAPRWPLFMSGLSDPEIEDIMDKLGDEHHPDEEDLRPLFEGVSEEDFPIIQAFRRFNLHKNDSSQDHPLSEDTSKQTNTSQDKPLPTLPTDKAIPRKALPLPPLSRPSTPNSSSVRVSTFKAEKKYRVRWEDRVPSQHANIEQGKGKDDLRSSDTVYAYIHNPSDYNVPGPTPKLKKKAGVEDLRQAGLRGD
ncbi:hypothetical protein ACN38_g6908 [Penicillium nordicum]|uniref:Uncharacterized protein n=1 Tax=Penicillium nordicum TaxID=229535 RepID=A0A0M8NZ81_9EURO|nr:hypothetical protein ACN38_g6908 [Penicillium nordicum]